MLLLNTYELCKNIVDKCEGCYLAGEAQIKKIPLGKGMTWQLSERKEQLYLQLQ